MADNPASPAGTGDSIDQPVCIAFQVGWDMSRLYRVASIHRPYAYTGKDKLPAQRDFGGTLNTERRMTAVSAGLRRLEQVFKRAELRCPSLGPLLSRYVAGASKEEIREAVYRLHVETLIALQAADARLGSAYNIGRVFADSATPSDLAVLKHSFAFQRVQGLRQELAQLAASFPPHAARAVDQSLCLWQCVISARLSEKRSSSGAEAALPRQAEVWRGLLSGERLATDRLAVEDYVGIGKRFVDRSRATAWTVVKAYHAALLLALGVVVAGLALTVVVGKAGSAIAGLAAAATALGISWKGSARR